jgi:hypothetical protein
VHLLCHLDSPSAASLPYLGLQEQTGPEVSGFCSSYRVPSRSSLLPLRTLSPGGVAHRPTSLTQSSTAWPQQPTGKTDKGFPNRFSSHRMISWSCFRNRDTTHRLAQLFPNKQGFFHSSPTQASCSGNALPGFLEQTQTPQFWTGVYTDSSGQTQAFFSVSKLHEGLLQTGSYGSGSGSRVEWRRNPPHGSSWPFYLHAPGLTLVTLGTACVPPARVPPTTWEITCPSKRT